MLLTCMAILEQLQRVPDAELGSPLRRKLNNAMSKYAVPLRNLGQAVPVLVEYSSQEGWSFYLSSSGREYGSSTRPTVTLFSSSFTFLLCRQSNSRRAGQDFPKRRPDPYLQWPFSSNRPLSSRTGCFPALFGCG